MALSQGDLEDKREPMKSFRDGMTLCKQCLKIILGVLFKKTHGGEEPRWEFILNIYCTSFVC